MNTYVLQIPKYTKKTVESVRRIVAYHYNSNAVYRLGAVLEIELTVDSSITKEEVLKKIAPAIQEQ